MTLKRCFARVLTISTGSSYSLFMAGPRNILDLEVIGYATVLKDTMLPSPVPPVFRLRSDPDRILFPPYHFADGGVWNATEGSPHDLKRLRENDEVTLFDHPYPAQPDFDMWIDLQRQPHYEPRAQARETLRNIARENIQKARQAFAVGEFEEADRFCGVALSADDRLVESLAIKAALCRKRNDPTGERVMEKLASHTMTSEAFQQLVNACLANHNADAASGNIVTLLETPESNNRPMQGMALERAA